MQQEGKCPQEQGRCRLCGQIVHYTRGNPVELGLHMIKCHHQGTVGQFALEECHACLKEEELTPPLSPSVPSPCPSRQSRPRTKCRKCSDKHRNYYTRGLYKTTLESWATGNGYMKCPKCKKQVRPLIRSQKHKVAYTSCGATCLLTCWPFCFLCPMMHNCSMDLYCPLCQTQLGTYDTTSGRVNTSSSLPRVNPCC